ncbi:MAG TPA: hypothetical protein VGH04_01700 [Gemmatimonadaceae bacterium]|jgi:hypothetical protein
MKRRSFLLAVLASSAAAAPVRAETSASRPEIARTSGDSVIALLGYHTKAPPSWSPRPPASSSRLAQFVIHGSDASSDAEVVVFFFGASQGGNVDANLGRWRSQFSTPDGSPVPETITRDSSGAFPVTTAEFRGTYRRGVGAGSADSVRIGQTLVASIVETPRGTLFIQLFGPTGTVAAHRAELTKFVRELK